MMNNPPKTGTAIRALQAAAELELQVISYRGRASLLSALLKRVIASSVLSFEGEGPEELVSLEADICEATKVYSCARCQDNGVIGWTTGQTPESFDQGEAPCPDCTHQGGHLAAVIAAEMNRLGYGLHESHAESIAIKIRESCHVVVADWVRDMDYTPEELGSPEPDDWDQSALAYHLSIAKEVDEMTGHAIPQALRERFSEIEDEAMKLGGCGVFTQMRTATQAHFEAARLKPLNAPIDPTDLFFVEKVLSKLARFNECAQDGQDADIGWHWFDVLVRLSLLNRVRQSPARWELTAQGEIALAYARYQEGKSLAQKVFGPLAMTTTMFTLSEMEKAALDAVQGGVGAIQVKHISMADMKKRYECQLCLRPYEQCVCGKEPGL